MEAVEDKVLCWQITNTGVGSKWMVCSTIAGVLTELHNHLENSEGEESDAMVIEPLRMTQTQIDILPEFPGW